MRSQFDSQLEKLNQELILMGTMVENAIEGACEALLTRNLIKARDSQLGDPAIDRKERDIEGLSLRMLLLQQPVARDLRVVSSAVKMITDMERIGDQAEDISEIIGFLNGRTGRDCAPIGDMAAATIKMVTESVDAFVKRDMALANAVIAYDDVVDELFVKVKSSLIVLLAENPQDGEYALDLLMIAKYFERIGDHATNIAEWVVFSVTGKHEGEQEARFGVWRTMQAFATSKYTRSVPRALPQRALPTANRSLRHCAGSCQSL